MFLSREDRAELDAELAPKLTDLGDRKTEADAKTIAYRLDPHGFVKRLSRAENDRHMSLRPAPDCMARLTALLPVKQGVAAYAALTRHADSRKATGDERGRGQIMADTLVERLTGQATADQVPVEVNLIMTDQALFTTGAGADEPAVILGNGVPPVVIPANLARRAALDPTGDTDVFLRRLYRNPTTGELAAMDSTSRTFTANQRKFLILRDQFCRTPFCGAPIRHADHVEPAANGATSTANGDGLCVTCNHAKQAEGWHQVRRRHRPDHHQDPDGAYPPEPTSTTTRLACSTTIAGRVHVARSPARRLSDTVLPCWTTSPSPRLTSTPACGSTTLPSRRSA